MDQWMDMDGGGQIQPKCCPRCKTPVKICLRYGDIIRNAFGDIVNAKKKILHLKGNPLVFFENTSGQLSRCRHLVMKCQRLKNSLVETIDKNLGVIDHQLKPKKNGKGNNVNPSLGSDTRFQIEVKLDVFERILELIEKTFSVWEITFRQIASYPSAETMKPEVLNEFFGFLQKLLRSLTERVRISTNEYRAVIRELDRLDFVRAYFLLQSALTFPVVGSPSPENLLIQSQLMKNIRVLDDGQKVEIKAAIKTLGVKLRTGIGISDKERKEIVQAMGMGQGHWFKCPNGHIYAIGDCGGAMVESRCNECHASIGGTRHQILSDNRHAGEMDNSTRPAWPQRN
jgi:hypothetical protein